MPICTKLVGIINLTSDSFSDQVNHRSIDKVIDKVGSLLEGGADVVDIGAESSNPNSTEISTEDEFRRLKVAVPEILATFPGIELSLDTRRVEVADWFLSIGGMIINDYQCLTNDTIIPVIRAAGCPLVLNHFPGHSIQEVHQRKDKYNDVDQVIHDLQVRTEELLKVGLNLAQIILDPGIGFGKTRKLNWELISIKQKLPDFPLMIGFSKKRFLGEQRFEEGPNKRAGRIAIAAGTDYLRIHEPKWFKEIQDEHTQNTSPRH